MSKQRAALERKIRRAMSNAICIGPMNQVENRIVKESEELAGYVLRLCMTYFWLGIGGMVIAQLIYRVVM